MSIGTWSPDHTHLPRLSTPYTQSFSPGISLGGSSLKPMAINLASASRRLLLSTISGMANDGDEGELTVTYITCPSFTFVPYPGDCAKIQLAGMRLLYP